jgi:hypothetical protein
MPAATANNVEVEVLTPYTEQSIRFGANLLDDETEADVLLRRKDGKRPSSSTPLLNALIDQLFDAWPNDSLVIDIRSRRSLSLSYDAQDGSDTRIKDAVRKAIEQVGAEA